MDFPEKEIYTKLVAALKAKEYYFILKGHPAPQHYDWDRIQYEADGEKTEFPFNRPAIFFRFGEMEFTEHGGNSKRGNVPLTVTCVQDKYVDAMDGATNQPEYLKLLEWKYVVHDVLNKFRGSCFGPVELVRINTDHENRNLHVETIDYEIKVTLMNNVIPPP
jgi:hypothetical protein